MKFVRILLKVLLGLVVFIILFLAVSLAPVDETPYQQMPYYVQTKARLAQLPAHPSGPNPTSGRVGQKLTLPLPTRHPRAATVPDAANTGT